MYRQSFCVYGKRRGGRRIYLKIDRRQQRDVRTRISIRSTLRQRWALPHSTIIYLFLFFDDDDDDDVVVVVVVYLVTTDRQECKYRLPFLYLRFVCPRSMQAIVVSICNVLLVATSLYETKLQFYRYSSCSCSSSRYQWIG